MAQFSVGKGETLGIVGESGCGKSTTARLIANLMPPDSGAMIFDGDGVAEFGGMALKDFRQNLQMVFQDSHASLNPRLTIGERLPMARMCTSGSCRRHCPCQRFAGAGRSGAGPVCDALSA